MSTEKDLSIFSADDDSIRSLTCIWTCNQDDDDFAGTLDQYLKAMIETGLELQLIVINNGLGSRASNRLLEALEETSIPTTTVNFSSPSPESTALVAAFRHTTGDVIALFPPYPQSDPRDVPRMLEAVRNGLDYVASWRTPRVDAHREQWKSRCFNLLTRWFSGIRLHDINSGLRMMRREVVQDLPLYGDLHIYLPILAAQQGFTVGEVPVRHLEERPSASGHGTGVYGRRALDLLTLFFLVRFTQKPFRFFGSIGGGLLAAGGVLNVLLAIQKIFYDGTLANRPILVFATLLIVLGIQLFSLGLIGELIIFVSAGGFSEYRVQNIYEHAQEKPDTAESA